MAHKYRYGDDAMCKDCGKPYADKEHVVIENEKPAIEYETTYETHWDYGGTETGEYRYCPECGEPIEEGDYVTVQPMKYYGRTILDVYHHSCFDE